jgi:gamma-glutamylcyclotransferase (GGCT)/AIG2-like uncharacterized protein YtfP
VENLVRKNVNGPEEAVDGKVAQGPGKGHVLFVYGTLKREYPNHYFLRNALFVDEGETVDSYALYFDEFPLVYAGEAIGSIKGEVYRIDDDTLHHLDQLEEYPDVSQRKEVSVVLVTGELVQAWMYFFPEPKGRLIPSGDFNLFARFDE